MNHPQFTNLQLKEIAPFVFQISLCRPEKKNALNTQLLMDLASTLSALSHDSQCRAVVICGQGEHFAAGADITEIAELSAKQALLDARVLAWQSIRAFPKPLIAAVEGYCLGGGFELMLACDFAIASREAQFAFPETGLGIMPGAGGTQILPRLIGKSAAMRLVLSGEFIGAETLFALGGISELTERGGAIKQSLEIAQKISNKAPFATQQAKHSILQSLEVGLEAGMKLERQAFSLLSATQDKKIGIDAFVNKEKPEFSGE